MKRLLLGLSLLVLALPAQAEDLPTAAGQAILVDMGTDTVLYEKAADERMTTASMSKLITAYMTFDALKAGRLSLDSKLTVSEHAWRMEGSRTYLALGSQVRVEDLIKGMVIQSGNDAAVTLAEGIGGTEDGFARLATAKARDLGMMNSNFANATGLPNPNHYSTARDLAILAMHIIRDFPEYYKYDAEREFTYNNIRQQNRNPLLTMNIGADGVKTGHTEENGYGMVGSAVQNNRRLLVVVNGLNTDKERADEAARLLQWGYTATSSFTLLKAGDVIDSAKVWMGQGDTVPLVLKQDIRLAMSLEARKALKANVVLKEPIAAPIQAGDQLGVVRVSVDGLPTKEFPLYARDTVAERGFFGRFFAKMHYALGGE